MAFHSESLFDAAYCPEPSCRRADGSGRRTWAGTAYARHLAVVVIDADRDVVTRVLDSVRPVRD